MRTLLHPAGAFGEMGIPGPAAAAAFPTAVEILAPPGPARRLTLAGPRLTSGACRSSPG